MKTKDNNISITCNLVQQQYSSKSVNVRVNTHCRQLKCQSIPRCYRKGQYTSFRNRVLSIAYCSVVRLDLEPVVEEAKVYTHDFLKGPPLTKHGAQASARYHIATLLYPHHRGTASTPTDNNRGTPAQLKQYSSLRIIQQYGYIQQ